MIVVGAPVHQRGWILRRWLDHLAAQDQELTLVMNYGHGTDDTLLILEAEDRFKVIVIETQNVTHVASRQWNVERYQVMVQLRNDILTVVRDLQPDYYLSCDTDMLLPTGAINKLIESRSPYDGIAPLTFMTTGGTTCPNWLTRDLERPYLQPGVTEQHAVFGTVLMTPDLYAVDYAVHPWGEDLGWAENVRNAGLRLALNTEVKVKHVMSPEFLDVYDTRVGM